MRTLARPLVAAPFVITGLETLREPGRRAEQVAPMVKSLADRMEWLPTKDPETLVRAEGALSLGTGALLALGRAQRLTAFLLAAQLVPALLTEHHYWTEDDPERRAAERSHMLKNASLFGALLMLATEPARHRRAAKVMQKARETRVQAAADARALRRQAVAEAKQLRREAKHQARHTRARAGKPAAR